MTLCHELCKNGWTDWDAFWVVDSDRPKEACIRWGAYWPHLVNTIEPSTCFSDAVFLSNCFDHLLNVWSRVTLSQKCCRGTLRSLRGISGDGIISWVGSMVRNIDWYKNVSSSRRKVIGDIAAQNDAMYEACEWYSLVYVPLSGLAQLSGISGFQSVRNLHHFFPNVLVKNGVFVVVYVLTQSKTFDIWL